MLNLENDIKSGSYKGLYLFFGEERYMSIYYKNRIINSIIGKDDFMNKKFFDETSDTDDILSFCMSYPFMAEKKVAIINNSGLFNRQSGFSDKLGIIPDTSILIFIEEYVDKRNRLYKYVQKSGRAIEFKKMDINYLRSFVKKLASEKKLSIDPEAVDIIIKNSSFSMYEINNELDKMMSYCVENGRITVQDCEILGSPDIEGRIFEMIDALAMGDKDKAIPLYQDLLFLRESPVKIIALIMRQFNIMLQIKMCDIEKKSAEKTLGIQSWIIGKYRKCARKYDIEHIKRLLETLASADYKIKSGRMDDRALLDIIVCSLFG